MSKVTSKLKGNVQGNKKTSTANSKQHGEAFHDHLLYSVLNQLGQLTISSSINPPVIFLFNQLIYWCIKCHKILKSPNVTSPQVIFLTKLYNREKQQTLTLEKLEPESVLYFLHENDLK